MLLYYKQTYYRVLHGRSYLKTVELVQETTIGQIRHHAGAKQLTELAKASASIELRFGLVCVQLI